MHGKFTHPVNYSYKKSWKERVTPQRQRLEEWPWSAYFPATAAAWDLQ